MKIAFVGQESRMGGVEYSTLRMADALDKTRFDPVLICPEEGDLPMLARQQGLAVSIVGRPKLHSVSTLINGRYVPNPLGMLLSFTGIYRAAGRLKQYLANNPVDLVVTKGLLAHFYGGMAAKKLDIPCIWYMQESVDRRRFWGLFQKTLVRGAEKFASDIIVDSEELVSQFEGLINKSILVIPNGIDTTQFRKFDTSEKLKARQKLGIPETALVIGQAGRLIPLKGQMITLNAFAKIAQEDTGMVLLFVGAPLFGDQDYVIKLRARSEALNIAHRTFFSGFLPDVKDGLAAMDIFVHASIETDSPLSVLEAMASELPVIVSRVPGCDDMFVQAESGLFFQPGDYVDLANKLQSLIHSPDMRSKLARSARKKILENYALQEIVTQFEEFIINNYAA